MNLNNAEAAAAVFEAHHYDGRTYGEIAEWSHGQAWGPATRGEVHTLYRIAVTDLLPDDG